MKTRKFKIGEAVCLRRGPRQESYWRPTTVGVVVEECRMVNSVLCYYVRFPGFTDPLLFNCSSLKLAPAAELIRSFEDERGKI